MPNVWPALDEDGVSLTVPDINGTPVPVNGLAVNSNEYNSYYSNLVFGGRLLTRDPLNSGDSPSTIYNAGAVQALDVYTELDALRGLYDDAQAQTADGYFWRWNRASTAGVAAPNVDGDGVRAPDVGTAGRWLQYLPVGSGTSTGTGDWTGPASGNTVSGIRNTATTAAPTDGTYYRASSESGNLYTTTATFTATAASGAAIPSGGYVLGALNGCQYEITVGGTEGVPTAGQITVTIRGRGPNAAIASGATVLIWRPAAGVSQTGTTNSAITVPSSELRLVPAPITDITRPRVFLASKMPNGDARPGMFPNSGASSVKALNALTASLYPGDKLIVDDDYTIDDTWVVGDAAARLTNSGFHIEGRNPVANNDAGLTTIDYSGASDRPAVLVSSQRMKMSGLCIRPSALGVVPTALVDVDYRFAAGNIRFVYFENMYFYNQFHTVGSLVRVGPSELGSGNFENIQFVTCRWQNIVTAGVEVYAGPQPYSMTFDRCGMYGFSDAQPRGMGIYNRNQSTSFVFNACDIQQCEAPLWTRTETCCAFLASQIENCKKLLYADLGTNIIVTFDGASRCASSALDTTTLGPIVMAASDGDVIYAPKATTLILNGVRYGGDGVEQQRARIHVGPQTAVYAKGIVWPTFEVLRRDQPATTGAHAEVSGTVNIGDGLLYNLYDNLTGTENSGGKVWIYGDGSPGVRSQIVQLPSSEPDANYDPAATFEDVVGSPALSDVWVSDKTTTSFKVNLSVDPGVGNARGIRWTNRKGRKKISAPTDFGASNIALWLRPGVSMTTGGGTCSAWADAYGNTFSFSGSQPVFVAANPNLNGLDSIRITQGTNESLQSTKAASLWEWMSDGTTAYFMWAVVYHPLAAGVGDQLGYTIGTKTSSSTTRGIGFKQDYSSSARFGLAGADGTTQGLIAYGNYTAGKRAWIGRISGPTGPAIGKSTYESSAWAEAPTLGGITLNPGTPQSTFRLQSQSTGQDLDIAEVGVIRVDASAALLDSFLQNYLVPLYGGLVSP
jgi:hypothetical protein